MEIVKEVNGTRLVLKITGRLDMTSSWQLSKEIHANIGGMTELVFDLNDTTYLSSAGIRVFVAASDVMKKQGSMKIVGVNENLMNVFHVIGFTNIMDIQPKGC